MKKFSILIIDIVDSRNLENRTQVQNRFKQAKEELSNKFSEEQFVSPEIIRGDELEAGHLNPAISYQFYRELSRRLYPVMINAGIGIGTISTRKDRPILEMDGPAFHRARFAVEKAETEVTNLVIRSNQEAEDKVLNIILNLICLIKNSWTARQHEIVNYYLSKENITQTEIAYEFDISQPAIAKTLSRTNVRHLEEANETIKQRMSDLID